MVSVEECVVLVFLKTVKKSLPPLELSYLQVYYGWSFFFQICEKPHAESLIKRFKGQIKNQNWEESNKIMFVFPSCQNMPLSKAQQ